MGAVGNISDLKMPESADSKGTHTQMKGKDEKGDLRDSITLAHSRLDHPLCFATD